MAAAVLVASAVALSGVALPTVAGCTIDVGGLPFAVVLSGSVAGPVARSLAGPFGGAAFGGAGVGAAMAAGFAAMMVVSAPCGGLDETGAGAGGVGGAVGFFAADGSLAVDATAAPAVFGSASGAAGAAAGGEGMLAEAWIGAGAGASDPVVEVTAWLAAIAAAAIASGAGPGPEPAAVVGAGGAAAAMTGMGTATGMAAGIAPGAAISTGSGEGPSLAESGPAESSDDVDLVAGLETSAGGSPGFPSAGGDGSVVVTTSAAEDVAAAPFPLLLTGPELADWPAAAPCRDGLPSGAVAL